MCRIFIPVNQRVSGSSPEGGAELDKAGFFRSFLFSETQKASSLLHIKDSSRLGKAIRKDLFSKTIF